MFCDYFHKILKKLVYSFEAKSKFTVSMPRKRYQKAKIYEGPPKKIRKFDSKLYNRICALPNELLEKIVSYIPFWHRPRLRKSCRRMRAICDSVLLHEFNSAIFDYSCKDPDGYEHAALTAIKDATWYYVLNGFESVFCGAILRLIWNNAKFRPDQEKIKFFLKHFYKLVNEQIGNSQNSRLLYCTTLMGFLKRFKISRLLVSMLIPPNYWRLVLELRGLWFGVLHSTKTAGEPHERCKLLMILCEIAIANSTHQTFKYFQMWECDDEVFVYGNDATERSDRLKSPTVLTFKIRAPRSIISLLKSCLEDDVVKWPKPEPIKEFMVLIDIECREALKWGCCNIHHIEIGPYLKGDEVQEDQQEEELEELTVDNPVISISSGSIAEKTYIEI